MVGFVSFSSNRFGLPQWASDRHNNKYKYITLKTTDTTTNEEEEERNNEEDQRRIKLAVLMDD